MDNKALPAFGFAHEDRSKLYNYAVITVGRLIDREAVKTPRRMMNLRAIAERWARETGLPLSFALTETTINWKDDVDDPDNAPCSGVIGLVTAFLQSRSGETPPVTFDPSEALDAGVAARIPEGFWKEVAAELGTELDQDVGVYLVPSGWSVAEIYPESAMDEFEEDGYLEGDPLVTVASEDTYPWTRLDVGEPAEALKSHSTLLLYASYA